MRTAMQNAFLSRDLSSIDYAKNILSLYLHRSRKHSALQSKSKKTLIIPHANFWKIHLHRSVENHNFISS